MYPSKQAKIYTKKKHQIIGCFFRLIIFPLAARLERRNFNVPEKEFFLSKVNGRTVLSASFVLGVRYE